jgi:glutamine cyclotransferase
MESFRHIVLPFLLALLVLPVSCSGKVKEYRVKVVKEYEHDNTSYTQGLFFDGGQMYESTGQWGRSTFRKVDMETGKPLKRLDFNKKYFIEGSVMLDGSLYILTWTIRVAFIYDASTLEYVRTVSYPREGWGLTTDGKSLIASDGSSLLYFMDKDLSVTRKVTVKLDGRPVNNLNELEWIDGKVWANVYMTDMIVIINPSDGRVEATVDCRGLLPRKLRDTETDVLNGIAYESREGKVYLTGKNWRRLYEIELIEK